MKLPLYASIQLSLLYCCSDVKLELSYLMEKLKQCKSSWFHIGLALGVPTEELKKFESERIGPGVNKCLVDTLMLWLNSGEANLDTLVKAIKLCDHENLSKKIRTKYEG